MMRAMPVGERWVGEGYPTYFIADIAANHDGDLKRAKLLIQLAAEVRSDWRKNSLRLLEAYEMARPRRR